MTVIPPLLNIPAHGAMRALRRHAFEAMQRRLLKVDDWAPAGFTIASRAYGTIFWG